MRICANCGVQWAPSNMGVCIPCDTELKKEIKMRYMVNKFDIDSESRGSIGFDSWHRAIAFYEDVNLGKNEWVAIYDREKKRNIRIRDERVYISKCFHPEYGSHVYQPHVGWIEAWIEPFVTEKEAEAFIRGAEMARLQFDVPEKATGDSN